MPQRAVTNEKVSLGKKFKPSLLSHFFIAGQSQCEVGENIVLSVSESHRNGPTKASKSEGGKEYMTK